MVRWINTRWSHNGIYEKIVSKGRWNYLRSTNVDAIIIKEIIPDICAIKSAAITDFWITIIYPGIYNHLSNFVTENLCVNIICVINGQIMTKYVAKTERSIISN